MDRGEHYDWLRADPAYAEAFAAAKPEAAQVLVDLAVERVKTGEFIPNVYQGRFIYPREEYEITPAIPAGDWKDEKATEAVPAVMGWRDVPGARPLGVYRRSEMLHAILLRAWVPEFKPGLELTGKDGGAIQVSLAEVLRERRAKRETATEAPPA